MMKFKVTLIACIICSLNAFGQKMIHLAGKVVDQDQNAVAFANVYLNNSSFFTASDSQGFFQLKIPFGVQAELVASFVGFRSQEIKLNAVKDFTNLVLILKGQELDEIVVSASRSKKSRRQWKLFKNAFLGKTWQAQQCEISNPEEVEITELSNSNEIKAKGKAPIIIENRALGYRITVNLISFKTDGTTSYIASKQFYEELIPEDEREKEKWERNRIKTYNSSFKNYLVELANNNTEEAEISIYEMLKVKKVFEFRTSIASELMNGFLTETEPGNFISKLENGNFEYNTTKPHLVILKRYRSSSSPFTDAPYQSSQIVLPKGNFIFSNKGWIINPNGLFIIGYWGNEALANLLPLDYLPQQVEQSLRTIEISEIAQKMDSITLEKVVFDTEITYDRQLTSYKNDRSSIKFDADYSYVVSEKDNNQTLLSIIKRIPGVRVASTPNDNGTEDYYITISGTNNVPCTIWYNDFIFENNRAFSILNQIDIKDIAKIELVKYDTAIFGVRGGGGVIALYAKTNN